MLDNHPHVMTRPALSFNNYDQFSDGDQAYTEANALHLQKILRPENVFNDSTGNFSRWVLSIGNVAGEYVLDSPAFEKADKPSELFFAVSTLA